MFKRLLVVGLAFLTTACVPITPEPTGPCISGERALLVGETIEAEPSDYLPGHVDIVKVESKLHDQVLTVVFHLRDIPEELTFYREGMSKNRIEYYWTVFISESGQVEPWTDEGEKMARFKYRLKTAHFAKKDEAMVPTTGSISSIANSDVWVLKRDEETDDVYSWYTQTLWEARIDVSHEQNTLKMTGYVPGVTRESLLVFETNDYLYGRDRIGCESARVSAQQSSITEVDIANPKLPMPKADLNDLANALAKLDDFESSEQLEGSEKHAAVLRAFADCFLGGMNMKEGVEGLISESGNAFKPDQLTALTMFEAGLFAAFALFEQRHVVEQADQFSQSVNMYELLEGALAVCEDSK